MEFAKLFAEYKINVVLVARNTAKLTQIKSELETEFEINVHIVATDLSLIDGLYDIQKLVEEKNLTIEYLVNNAGFGDYKNFVDRSIEKYREVISLNINMPTELTYYFSKKMVERGSGKILNVASTASR